MSFSHQNPMPSISTIHKALADFQLSPSTFRILYSISSSSPSPRLSSPISSSTPQPKTLYILDSSFNPPTHAHLEMATSALHSHRHHHHHASSSPLSSPSPCQRRLLLLLATQNADKQFGPASFERRLTMMGLLAGEIARKVGGARGRRKMKAESTSPRLPPQSPIVSTDDENDLENDDVMESDENIYDNNTDDDVVTVDIGVTKKPYFHDKAAAIATSGAYCDYAPPPPDGGGGGEEIKMEQVYLVGFDTLIRLLNPKYYPPSRTSLRGLDPFFSTSRVRVTRRAGGDYEHEKGGGGGRDPLDEYLRALAAGDREGEGGRREWAQRVQLVGSSGEDDETEEQMISSTKVREAMKRGDEEVMKRLVPEEVGRFILDQGIYRQDGD